MHFILGLLTLLFFGLGLPVIAINFYRERNFILFILCATVWLAYWGLVISAMYGGLTS